MNQTFSNLWGELLEQAWGLIEKKGVNIAGDFQLLPIQGHYIRGEIMAKKKNAVIRRTGVDADG